MMVIVQRQRKVRLKMTIAPQNNSTNGTILQKLSISTIIAGICQKRLCASILDISTGIISLNCDRFAHKNYPQPVNRGPETLRGLPKDLRRLLRLPAL